MVHVPRLLVSVRCATEAQAALDGGAGWIDVKEPTRGALGRADDAVLAAVAAVVAGRRPLSAALGELLDSPAVPTAFAGWVKVGLAGCRARSDWPARLDAMAAAAGAARLVIAGYADWERADAPPPAAALEFAADRGCAAFLLDTWAKDGRGLLAWCGLRELVDLCRRCRRAGLPIALAGSLGPAEIARLAPLEPDLFAVRGAACRGGERGGPVDPAAVRRLAELVSGRERGS
jgi:uncharacterized protein (UPF0264 family)